MFKQLLGTVAATICCLGNPSAMAAPTSCWLATSDSPDQVAPQTCDVDMRINANGHKVVDIVTVNDGARISVVFWKDDNGNPSYAEVFFGPSQRTVWSYRYDNDGDVHLYHRGTRNQIWFTPPSRTTVTHSA